jgi:hypothetical protein
MRLCLRSLGVAAGAVVGLTVSCALVWAPVLFNPYSLHQLVLRDAAQIWDWLSGAEAVPLVLQRAGWLSIEPATGVALSWGQR